MSAFHKLSLLICLFIILGTVMSHDICNFTITLQRHIQQRGFHRDISYNFVLENHSIEKSDKPVYYYHECILAVQQLLPAGLYVDPDELEDLRRANKLSAYPQTGVSTEAAAPYSRPFNAFIFAPVEYYKVDTYLPMHARYQSPVEGGGLVANVIEKPSVYLRCLDNRLEKCNMTPKSKTFLCDMEPLNKDKKCLWKQALVETSNSTMVWKVPVGNLNHYIFVELGTFVALVLTSAALIKVTLDHPATARLSLRTFTS